MRREYASCTCSKALSYVCYVVSNPTGVLAQVYSQPYATRYSTVPPVSDLDGFRSRLCGGLEFSILQACGQSSMSEREKREDVEVENQGLALAR